MKVRRHALKWVNLSFRRSIAGLLAAFMIFPLFLPSLAMAAELSSADTTQSVISQPVVEAEAAPAESPGDTGPAVTADDAATEVAAEEPAAEESADNPTVVETVIETVVEAVEGAVAAVTTVITGESAPAAADKTDVAGVSEANQPDTVEGATQNPHPPMPGAIYTSDVNGNININHYDSKSDVYLNGGPDNIDNHLPEGDYYWKITGPNGHDLLGDCGGLTFHIDENGQFPRFCLWTYNPDASHYDDTTNPGGEYEVWISQDDQFPNNESKTDNFKVLRNPEIAIDKVDSPDPIGLGGTTVYTITVSNTGNMDLENAVVVDKMPDGMEYVSSVPDFDSHNGDNGDEYTWNLGDLPDQGNDKVITVVARGTDVGTHKNCVTVTADVAEPSGDIGAQCATEPETPTVTASDCEETTVLQPDVSITKTDSVDPILIGGQTEYTLTVTNTGDTTLTNVIATDELPDGMSYVDSDPTATSVSGKTISWNLDTLAVNGEQVIHVTAQGDTDGTWTNVANVTTGQEVSDEAEETTTVQTPAVSITKTDSGIDPIWTGDNTEYTLTVTNTGTSMLTGVTVTDTLPDGLGYISSDPTATVNGQDLSWDIGSMAVGEEVVLHVTATGVETGTWINHAYVTTNEEVSDEGQEDTTVKQRIWSLAVDKTDRQDPVLIGHKITYDIVVTNTGNQPLYGISVFDSLPAGLTYVSSNPPSPNPTWTIASLQPGESYTITLQANPTRGGHFRDVVTALSEMTRPAQASECTRVLVPRVKITKDDSVDPIMVGENTVYTLRVKNKGTATLTGVRVTDTLPAGMSFVSSSRHAHVNGQHLSWYLGRMRPGAVRVIKVTVEGTAKGHWRNTAKVTTRQRVSDHDCERTEIIDPILTKVDAIDPVYVGHEETYTITFTNTGQGTLTDRELVDTLPDGLEYVSSNPPASLSNGDKTLTWNIASLPGGQSYVVEVVVLATESGTYTNEADIGDKHAEEETTVYDPSVRIYKYDSLDPILVGENTTYTIEVQNTGDTTLTGVTVTDDMPAGMSYVSSDTSATELGGSYVWSLGDIPVGGYKLITVVATGVSEGFHTNEASVTTEEGVSDETEEPTEVIDPELTKVDSDDPILVGENTTYTITFTNTGEQRLGGPVGQIVTDGLQAATFAPVIGSGRQLVDTLPEGMEYVSSDPPATVSSDGRTLTWDIPALLGGESFVAHVVVRGTTDGTHTNNADVGDKHAEEQTTVLQPSVSIEKVDSVDPILLGENTTYTITVTNTGDATLTGVAVSDVLPGSLGYVASSEPLAGGPGLNWNLGDLAPGESHDILVEATGNETGTVTNVASVSVKELEEPKYADEPTTVNAPEDEPVYTVAIDKTDTKDPILEGESTDYIITVKNTGNQPLTNVRLTDAMPVTFGFVASTMDVNRLGNDLIWDLKTLEPGDEVEVGVTAQSSLFGEYLNVANVDADELAEPASADEPTLVEAALKEQYAVGIEKTDDVDPAQLGQNVIYTITVTNEGNEDLTGVTVTDNMPEGLTYTSSDANVELVSGSQYALSIDTLEPGESRTFKMITTAAKTGTWTNVASVNAKELDDPETTSEDTTIQDLVAAVVFEPASTGSTLPFTGFPRTIWMLTAFALITTGLWLEVTARRRRLRNRSNT